MKENRRTVYVVLTKKGMDLVHHATEIMVGAMTQVLLSLPEEKLLAVTELTDQLNTLTKQEV